MFQIHNDENERIKRFKKNAPKEGIMNKTKSIVVSLAAMAAMGLLAACDGSSESSTTAQTVIEDSTTTETTNEDNATTEAAPDYKSAGWYGKTMISATTVDGTVYTHNTAGIFGELIGSTEAKDSNDVPGYGTALLQVVFPQTTWGDDNGDYFSDYQSFIEGESPKRVWTFQIKNQKTVDLKDASIRITLDGIYDVTYLEENGRIAYKESTTVNTDRTNKLTLVDVDNHTTYTPAELKTADLSMDGLNVRTFRWVKGDIEESDYTPLTVVVPAQSAKVSGQETQSVYKETVQETDIGFGRPPQSN